MESFCLQRKEEFMEQVPASCSLKALFLQEEAENQKQTVKPKM